MQKSGGGAFWGEETVSAKDSEDNLDLLEEMKGTMRLKYSKQEGSGRRQGSKMDCGDQISQGLMWYV